MKRVRAVVLDNEAVQALLDPAHRKHRRALAVVEAVTARQTRRAGAVRLIVPTSVRVEAGWDRRAGGSVAVNRLRADDAVLDRPAADLAAAIRTSLRVSVADAHLGAVLTDLAGAVAVLTSDIDDVRRICAHTGVTASIVGL